MRADWREPIATTLSSCDRGAASPFSVCSPRNPDVLVSRKGAIPERCRCPFPALAPWWAAGCLHAITAGFVGCMRSPTRGRTAAAGPP